MRQRRQREFFEWYLAKTDRVLISEPLQTTILRPKATYMTESKRPIEAHWLSVDIIITVV